MSRAFLKGLFPGENMFAFFSLCPRCACYFLLILSLYSESLSKRIVRHQTANSNTTTTLMAPSVATLYWMINPAKMGKGKFNRTFIQPSHSAFELYLYNNEVITFRLKLQSSSKKKLLVSVLLKYRTSSAVFWRSRKFNFGKSEEGRG